MKKLYSFIALAAAMFIAVPANAKIGSAADLYGTWAFSADIAFEDPSYQSAIHTTSEVIITSDPQGTYAATIEGLCGVESSIQMVAKVVDLDNGSKGIQITNPNGANYDAWGSLGLWMTDMSGKNPFSIGYGRLYYEVSDDGEEISIPDFKFVSVPEFSQEEGILAATVTNAKLTLVSKEVIEVKDLSGEYKATVNPLYDYGVVEGWPTEYSMTIAKKDDTNKLYDITWVLGEDFATLSFEGTFDGNTLTMPFDNMLAAYDSIYLAPIYDTALDGTITYNVTGDNLSLSSGVCFAVPHYDAEDALTLNYIFWYGGGIAKLQKEGPAMTYDGEYSLSMLVSYDLSGGTTPTSGTMKVEYFESWGMYMITEFLGFDTYTLNQGGIELRPDPEDPMKATIELDGYNFLQFLGEEDGDYKYYVMLDGNLTDTAIPVTFDEDGNMNINQFCIGTGYYFTPDKYSLVTWYTGVNAKKIVPSAQDWIGTREMTPVTYAYINDKYTVPTTGNFTVSYYEAEDLYLVEEFLGYDLYTANYGGLELIPDENDPHKATLKCGFAEYDMITGYKWLYDGDLKKTSIDVTLNDDGTVTVNSDFSIIQAGNPFNVLIATTSAKTGIEEVKAVSEDDRMFDINGREVNGDYKGIVIRNIGGKFVKTLNK